MENIEITAIKGEVIGLQKHSKTKVYSTGGGGFVSQNGGYVASPQIRSNSTQINEFFVKTKDGKETHVKLTNIDVAMRDGHTITMIMAKNKNVKHGYWIAAVNHDTEKIHYLYSENNLLDMGVTKGSLKITSPSSLLMIGAIVAIVYVVTKTVEYLEIPVNEKFFPTTLLIMLVGYLAGLGYLSHKRKKADGLSRHEFLKKVDQCY